MQVQIDWDGDKEGIFAGTGAETAHILCEKCEDPITKERPGVLVYTKQGPRPIAVPVVFLHKSTCDPGTGSWIDLDRFMLWISAGLSDD